MRIAILGQGEAGRRCAEDPIAAGWKITGYDPAPVPEPPGVIRIEPTSDAVREAEMVLSLAATVLEAVSAGAAAGCEDWVRDRIAASSVLR